MIPSAAFAPLLAAVTGEDILVAVLAALLLALLVAFFSLRSRMRDSLVERAREDFAREILSKFRRGMETRIGVGGVMPGVAGGGVSGGAAGGMESLLAYANIAEALSGGYECVYYIDLKTNHFDQFRSQGLYETLKVEKAGEDFFALTQRLLPSTMHPDDVARMAAAFTPEAMKAVAAADSRIRVKVLPTKYPQGGEKVLVYHTVGAKLPAGALPLEAGCVVCNTSTVAAIGNYLRTGMPLVERCVTVDGSAVAEPKNVLVPIGTALADVFAFCGGYKVPPQKILYGGPMMGVAVPNDGVSILKNTNAILAFGAREARLPDALTCIRCGECMLHCPVGLNPAYIGKAYQNKDVESLERLNVNLCMECGCCAYVCPAHRDLVQNNRLAKDMLRKAKAAEEGK